MTKFELMKHIELLPDDAEITFALFDTSKNGYVFKPIASSANIKHDPADVIVMVENRLMPIATEAKQLSQL